ncbi:MAG: hypothetical protein U0795_13540 [Pirellulales bacterium]
MKWMEGESTRSELSKTVAGSTPAPGPAAGDSISGSPAGLDPSVGRTWLTAIVAGLIVWGLVLAVGATGIYAGLFDVRRGLIVLVTMATFLLGWLGLLMARARRVGESTVSRPAVVSAFLWGLMAACWVGSIREWPSDQRLAVMLGWSAVGLWGSGCLAVMVALSDPVHRRGRWIASVGLAIAVVCVVVFWRRW